MFYYMPCGAQLQEGINGNVIVELFPSFCIYCHRKNDGRINIVVMRMMGKLINVSYGKMMGKIIKL